MILFSFWKFFFSEKIQTKGKGYIGGSFPLLTPIEDKMGEELWMLSNTRLIAAHLARWCTQKFFFWNMIYKRSSLKPKNEKRVQNPKKLMRLRRMLVEIYSKRDLREEKKNVDPSSVFLQSLKLLAFAFSNAMHNIKKELSFQAVFLQSLNIL